MQSSGKATVWLTEARRPLPVAIGICRHEMTGIQDVIVGTEYCPICYVTVGLVCVELNEVLPLRRHIVFMKYRFDGTFGNARFTIDALIRTDIDAIGALAYFCLSGIDLCKSHSKWEMF